MKTQAFWDASVLVPLCADQPLVTAKARRLSNTYSVAAWWGTPVEVTSALMRLHRSSYLTTSEYMSAVAELDRMITDWFIVEPVNGISPRARKILETYPLRAGDALQLAAALEWCEGWPQGFVFLTADRRLAEAAESAGFTLEPGLI